MIRIYYETDGPWFLEHEAQLYQSLGEEGRARVDRAAPSRRNEALLSGALLEGGLRLAGIAAPYRYGASERGKPYLLNEDNSRANAEFSLSHTKGISAAALSDTKETCPLGVDVEAVGRFRPSVVERFFTEHEKEKFALCAKVIDAEREKERRQALERERQRLFARLWTGKEAIAKCLDEPLVSVCRAYDLTEDAPQKNGLNLSYHETEGFVLCCCAAGAQEMRFLRFGRIGGPDTGGSGSH